MRTLMLSRILIALTTVLASGMAAGATADGGQKPGACVSPPEMPATDVEFPACCYRGGRYWKSPSVRECARRKGYIVLEQYCSRHGPPPPADLVCCRSGDRIRMTTQLKCHNEYGRVMPDRACRTPMPPPGAPVCCRRRNRISTVPRTICTRARGGVMIRARHCRTVTRRPPEPLVCCMVGGDMIMKLTKRECREYPGVVYRPSGCR